MAAVVVFFALTRTEVGREGLQKQVERQFARSFDGTLEIEELRGNLLNRLSAGSVVLRDSAGVEILRVDSVIVQPSWRDLFNRTISTGRITLIGPQVNVHRTADGSWNVETLLGSRRPPSDEAPWAFRATRVQIVNGRIGSRNHGSLPPLVANGTLLNYADSEIRGIHGRAIIDWGQDLKLIDILEFDAHLPEVGLAVAGLRGQLVLDDESLSLNEAYLQIGNSNLHLNASISALDELRAGSGDVDIQLDLDESTLDAGELARLIPALPLRDVVTTSIKLQGSLADLMIEDLELRRGSSLFAAMGRVRGLPDSLSYELAVRPSIVHWHDLAAVWPTTPLPNFDHLEQVELAGYSDGIWHFGAGDHDAKAEGSIDFAMDSRAGSVRSEGTFAWDDHDDAVHMDGVVEATDFNVGVLIKRPDLASNINGRLELDGSASSLYNAHGRAGLLLGPSSFAYRSIDTLSVSVEADGEDVRGSLAAVTDAGSATAHATGLIREGQISYHLDGDMAALDIGRIIREDSLRTSLNAHISLDGQGTTLRTLGGDLAMAFDTSRVAYRHNIREILPHETRLSLHQHGSEQPRIEVKGDVFELAVTGNVALAPMVQLARAWVTAYRADAEREIAKRYQRSEAKGRIEDKEAVAPNMEEAEEALAAHNLEDQRWSIEGRILRSDIFSALLPGVPDLHTNLAVSATIDADARQVSLVADVAADSLFLNGIRSDALSGRLQLHVPADDRPAVSSTGELSMRSSRLSVGGQTLISPTVDLNMRNRRIALIGEARAVGAVEPFHVDAHLALEEGRNRLSIGKIQLAARDQAWINPDSSVIDIYQDAAVVRGLRLERLGGDASAEHFTLQGTLSNEPGDTLFVEADDILLEHVASMFAVEKPLGGSINGRLAFTGLKRQPELTGQVRISPLTYENRLLGEVQLTSRYIPGSPDVALALALRPHASAGNGFITYENRLALEGTFRLPGAQLDDGRRDPGSLDLDLRVSRADAFFFEYIFSGDVSNVQGYLSGGGHIGGDFSTPLFDARLDLEDGKFDVAEFNLEYTASGPISVDREGIHLGEIRVADSRGEAVVGGSVLFNRYRYFSLDLHGNLSNLQIMRVSQSRDLPFYGTIRASGDMSLTGPLSSATLRSENAVTSPDSDLYIPITGSGEASDAGFIVFADSAGHLPDFGALTRRRGVLAERPEGERPFLDGLEIDLNISAPEGSTVHLVIDPLLGDVINAVGSGRIELVRSEGEFSTFGTFDVRSGDYLFTAGEVFFRRFMIDNGTIMWDGDPLDAMLNIAASYRTRASPDGLGIEALQEYIPLIIRMNVGGRVSTPSVDLSLALDRDDRNMLGSYESSIEAQLNQPEHVAQYATSVLLTNSFLLTTSAQSQLSDTRNQLAFNSLSQLVASQLNRYLNYALPNVDLSLGVQGESTQDLDVTYGVALRLLDERLVIRGEGIYQSDQLRRTQQGVLDEFVVEVRLNPRVSVEVFYRREGDVLDVQSLNTSTTGAGLSYQTEFPTWRRLVYRLFGWIIPTEEDTADDEIAAGAGD